MVLTILHTKFVCESAGGNFDVVPLIRYVGEKIDKLGGGSVHGLAAHAGQ